ncbi:hypothetical protein GCM10023322_60750 [Rugosimonospora acidiphila]|uniref:Transcription regulator PadR N-terminal domain-containing protein n=1 Tax=Rugosimonospora acidiphila TaxID=556531 RepID=A0ABP9SES1_9ACTN
MTAVFSHGRLRLYLLKLLAEGPKHGYELIRLLENRFLGLYAPSAGTIYPRLQRMESEGLVTHTQAGGRKVYELTGDGRAELTQRAGELADLEAEIHASVADLTTLASEIEQHVSGSVRDIKQELRDAARQVRSAGRAPWQQAHRRWTPGAPAGGAGTPGPWTQGADGSPVDTNPVDTNSVDTNSVDGNQGHGGPDGDRGTRTTGDSRANAPAFGDLERAVGQLASEVRRMARQGSAGEAQLRAATAVVSSALTELRRLLRE